MNEIDVVCCAECGEAGGASLKVCKSCMHARYCNAACQHKHWPKHKAACKLRAAELRDEVLFKDPPPKEDCPICFIPMPILLVSCITLPDATISAVPIFDFAQANEGLAKKATEAYYPCCGKNFCRGCIHSCLQSGNHKCPFCNSDRSSKTREENNEDLMKRAEANDAASICVLADFYQHGLNGLQQDCGKAMELYARAADLGFSKAHINLAEMYLEGGYLKKAKFHFESAAMAGHEVARYIVGHMEKKSGNMDRAIKHWTIAASAGEFDAMHKLRTFFEKGYVSRESINSTLTAYNNACAEMRSEARDAFIRVITKRI
jgi:hypothetical protein